MESEQQHDGERMRWDSVHKCPQHGQPFRLADLNLKAITTGMVACLKCDWAGSINIQIIPRASCMELRQLVVFIDINLLLDKAGMIVLANQLRHSLGLEEGQHIGELVVHCAGESFFVLRRKAAKRRRSFRSISSREHLSQDSWK